jgi:hypothetical protein
MHLECNNHVASFTREEALVDKFHPLSDEPIGIPSGEFTFIYDYPLSTEAKFKHELGLYTSIIDILLEARADYRAIYAIEDAATGVAVGTIAGMVNRAQSSGPFGVWGHVISDLYFEGVDIDLVTRRITFSMGS